MRLSRSTSPVLVKTPDFWAAAANNVTHSFGAGSTEGRELTTPLVAKAWLSYSGALPLRLKFTGFPRYMVDLMDLEPEAVPRLRTLKIQGTCS